MAETQLFFLLRYTCSCDDGAQRQVFASVRSNCVCVQVCVCVSAGHLTGNEDKQPALRNYSPSPGHKEREILLSEKNCLCLIDLTVLYLILNENCSHPAQAISEGL